jgi:lysophospholipase L1-like esterase
MSIFLRRLLVVVVNVVIFVGVLGLLEFAARRIQSRRLGAKASQPSIIMDRWTGWRNAPGYERIDIRHNSQGFRHDGEVALQKAPNTVRIFFLGGSAAYGCEGLFPELDPEWKRIDNGDLINVALQKKLRERHPERQWEVINAATNEFRLHQSLMLIYSKLLRYRPDLMIFMDGHNDLSGMMLPRNDPYDPYEETPHSEEFSTLTTPRSLRALLYSNTTWLRYNSVLFEALQRRVINNTRADAFGSGGDHDLPVPVPVKLDDLKPPWREMAVKNMKSSVYYSTEVERISSALGHEGIPVLHSLQPELILSHKPLTSTEQKFASHMRDISGRYITYMYENLRPEISRRMATSAEKNGFAYVDLEDVFDGVKEKTFTDYCHLTAGGNERIAERLYQGMEAQLIPQLVAGKRPTNGGF